MRIGATVSGPDRQIVPLPDGEQLVVFDTQQEQERWLANPAQQVQERKRLAVAEELIRQQVEAVVAVPLAFCPTSHARARKAGIQFIPVPVGTTWSQVRADPAKYLASVQAELPAEQLAHHGAGHSGH